MKKAISILDERVITAADRLFVPVARLAFFVIFFWFGFIKLIGVSPATPLAESLTERTIGLAYFDPLFIILSLFECIIGLLFLVPKAVRIVIPLLLIHMLLVCSPLVLLPELTWQAPFVPTLEGQYIIKNIVVVALAIGIAANTKPLWPDKR